MHGWSVMQSEREREREETQCADWTCCCTEEIESNLDN